MRGAVVVILSKVLRNLYHQYRQQIHTFMRGLAMSFSVILKISQVFDNENKHNVSSLLTNKIKRAELFPPASLAKISIYFKPYG